MSSESVWYGAPPPAEAAPAPEGPHEDARHLCLRENARYFLPLSLALGAVFALLFVNAYALGLNAALLAAAMAAATVLALGKLGQREKKRDIFWSVSLVLLGLSIAWTANAMTQDVSFLGMFLAELLWLMNAFADILSWRFGRVVSSGFRLVGRIIAHLGEPFRHLAALRRGGGKNARGVLLGIVIVCNATAFISLVHILIGIFTLVTGTLQVQSSVDAKRFGMPKWWLLLIGAILTMALGVLLVIAPFEGTLAIVCLLGATLIVEGIENLFILLYMVKYRNN